MVADSKYDLVLQSLQHVDTHSLNVLPDENS